MERIKMNVCRTCLTVCEKLTPIFNNESDKSFDVTLMAFAPITVKDDDGLPSSICEQCIIRLNDAHTFRKVCENSDAILRESKEPFKNLFELGNNTVVNKTLGITVFSSKRIPTKDMKPCQENCIYKKTLDFINTMADVITKSNLVKNRKVYKKKCSEVAVDVRKKSPERNDFVHIKLEESSDELANVGSGDSLNVNGDLIEPKTEDLGTDYVEPKFEELSLPIFGAENELKDKIVNAKLRVRRYCCKKLGVKEKLKKPGKNIRFPCLYCNKAFRKEEVRNKHQTCHTNRNKTLNCQFCNKLCKTRRALLSHEQTHTGAMKMPCSVCNKIFSSPANLKRHMMIHNNERPHMCHYCGLSFNQQGSRDNHIMVKHSPDKKHRCTVCTMRFELPEQLAEHITKHVKNTEDKVSKSTSDGIDILNTTCSICKKVFGTQANLKQHIKWHLKPELCTVCGKGYATRHALKNHERIHSGDRPFACQYCDKSFTINAILRQHLKSHSEEIERKYACSFCPKKFSLAATLKTHTYTHTGEKPYPCTICDKRFNQNAHLRTHMILHTGLKKHVCDICNKAFALPEGLRYHIMTHTGETPHVCGECGRGFYIYYKLRIHMAKTHGIVLPSNRE